MTHGLRDEAKLLGEDGLSVCGTRGDGVCLLEDARRTICQTHDTICQQMHIVGAG